MVVRGTDYERMASVYDSGRSVPLEGLTGWRNAVSPLLGRASSVLDVGAGTGLWAEAFVEWFDLVVIAIEPSNNMRAEAGSKRQHQDIAYIGGRAEQLPLRDDSCGCAWLSTVVHHFTDVTGSARELRRVLPPGAPVLIRSAFAGRSDGVTWLRFWPHARTLAESRWPTVEAVVSAFSEAGFELESLTPVTQQSAPSLSVYRNRLRMRADSTLAQLSDEAFDAGLRALDVEAANEREPHPVIDRLDLLVLR